MKKRMLADVLWKAANEWLCPTGKGVGSLEQYSCSALGNACGGWMPCDVRSFITSLGCDTYSTALLHEPWKCTPQSQGVRYMWLLLAMKVAEDEGIEL